jgi:Fe-S oxidoreductase
MKILNAGGVDFDILYAEEYCCGAPLWRTGQFEAARKLAERNLDAIKKQGIRTLIVSCAECYGTLKGFYPRIATRTSRYYILRGYTKDADRGQAETIQKSEYESYLP